MCQLVFQGDPTLPFRPYMYFEYQSTFLLYRSDRQQFLAFHKMSDMSLGIMMTGLKIYLVTDPDDEILQTAAQWKVNLKFNQIFELHHLHGVHLVFASGLSLQQGPAQDLMQPYAVFMGDWQQLYPVDVSRDPSESIPSS